MPILRSIGGYHQFSHSVSVEKKGIRLYARSVNRGRKCKEEAGLSLLSGKVCAHTYIHTCVHTDIHRGMRTQFLHCLFSNNTAEQHGGGMYFTDGFTSVSCRPVSTTTIEEAAREVDFAYSGNAPRQDQAERRAREGGVEEGDGPFLPLFLSVKPFDALPSSLERIQDASGSSTRSDRSCCNRRGDHQQQQIDHFIAVELFPRFRRSASGKLL